jgi:ubiquinol-cytochrome c reductase cytochrome c1 subunit
MKKLAATLLLFMYATAVQSSGSHIVLDHADVDIYDKPSLQRGVALFSNYCMGCHSMKYSRYERVADDLGIPHELYTENLIFDDTKIGQLMEISMDPKMAASWFGAPPPDLSLIARLRGADWLYTYLRAFYKDESRPWGVNNAVFKDVGMPHVLLGVQGLCAHKPHFGETPEIDPMSGQEIGLPGCQSFVTEGSMTPVQFDQAMLDLTNFLVYVGEPSRYQANAIAPIVLIFLVILFVPAYLLNREYWKDVH